MSDCVRPHRRQPTRLPRPWNSPGKNTGVGCHCLLQYMKVKSENEVAQSCLTLSNPMDCSLPATSIHRIFQARVPEQVATAFSSETWGHSFFFFNLYWYFTILFFLIYFILFFNFTILYWFCHTSTWIHHRYTRVPHPELSSLLPPRTIPLGHPSAPAPSIQCRASNLDWRLVAILNEQLNTPTQLSWTGGWWSENIQAEELCLL